MDAKAVEAEVAQLVEIEPVLAEVEQGRVEGQRPLAGRLDHVDLDRLGDGPTLQEQHQLERQFLAAPDRLVRAEADVAVLVVVEVPDLLGHADRRRLVGLLGQRLSPLGDVLEAEGERRRAGQRAEQDEQQPEPEKRENDRTHVL